MSPRILLVEDSPMISSALKVLLEAGGYDVVVASTAMEARKIGLEIRPDVLLLDITLPDEDGLSVLRTLDAEGFKPAATFAMTGHTDPETRARCIEAGCDDVLVKPVPVRQLLQIVSQAVA